MSPATQTTPPAAAIARGRGTDTLVCHIAARWGLAGPVVCTIPAGRGLADAMDSAALLIEGCEADAALVVLADQGGPDGDRGVAMLVGPPGWRPVGAATRGEAAAERDFE